jgi:hypothetical protein
MGLTACGQLIHVDGTSGAVTPEPDNGEHR